jgi:hypothetical protein
MRDKMLLNGAAGPGDGLWGLNAPSGFDMPEWRAAAAWRGREKAQQAGLVGADCAVRRSKRSGFAA